MYHGLIFNVNDHVQSGRSNGAYRIAHIIRELGWDIEVADWALLWSLEELKTFTASRVNSNTRFFGFSHMFSVWSAELESFCEWCHEKYPDIVLISGSGVLPSFNTSLVHYYVHGFGEVAITSLLSYLFSNGPLPLFEPAQINGGRLLSANDHYQAYPLESLLVTYQDRDFIQPDEWLSIEFARGCKFSCTFCNFPVLGVKGDYSRSQTDFERHIKDAHERFGVKNYYVMDETFNDRTEKITKFADVVEKLSFRPYFAGFMRADLLISRPADREQLLRMNFVGQFYGIESLNHQTGKAVGKGMHPDKIKSGLLDLKSYYGAHSPGQYSGTISLIVGLPHETISTIGEANAWLLENWQGQFWTWIPFEIPTGERDKKSVISENYELYGYSEIPGTQSEYHTAAVRLGKAIKWKNPNMDYYDSWRLAAQFNEDALKGDIRLPCYYLGFLSPRRLSLHERLNTHLRDLSEIQSQGRHVVDRYKRKKLDCVP